MCVRVCAHVTCVRFMLISLPLPNRWSIRRQRSIDHRVPWQSISSLAALWLAGQFPEGLAGWLKSLKRLHRSASTLTIVRLLNEIFSVPTGAVRGLVVQWLLAHAPIHAQWKRNSRSCGAGHRCQCQWPDINDLISAHHIVHSLSCRIARPVAQ
jgi:hypothetical protein